MSVKILVVDDELLWQRIISQQFKKKIRANEYEFIFVHNGKQALEKIQSERQIDLMLTDINMPEMDGLTLLRKLNDRKITIKTVIISAYGNMPNIRKAMNEGAFDFITKPIDFQELEKTIEKTLQKSARSVSVYSSAVSPTVKSKELTLNESGKKPRSNSVLRLAKELSLPQQLGVVSELIETFGVEEIEELRYKLEAQLYIASENQEERELLQVEDRERELRNEIPLSLFQNGWIESRYTYKQLSTGEKKRYGPYFYLRWREGGKLRSKFLGKDDPRAKTDSNNHGVASQSLPPVSQPGSSGSGRSSRDVEPRKARLDRPLPEKSQSTIATATPAVDNAVGHSDAKSAETSTLSTSKPPIKLYGPAFDKPAPSPTQTKTTGRKNEKKP